MRVSPVLVLASLALAGPVEAAGFKVRSRASLIQPAVLAPLLERGELALIESNVDGSLAQVVLFAAIDAPREQVFDLINDVESYPKFLHTIEKTKIQGRQGGTFEYYWKLAVPMISLDGTRLQRGRRPDLIEVRGHSGNFVRSEERWELYPLGPNRTLAAFYRTLDIETGGFVLKTMASLEPSMEKALSVGSGFVHVRELKQHVLGKAKEVPAAKTGPVPPFRPFGSGGGAELVQLRGLLELGQLVLIESEPDAGLKQVALATIVNTPVEKVASVVRDPASYPKFIPTFARQDVTPIDGGKLKLDWELEVPFENLEGVSVMSFGENSSVDIVAESGDIDRARWRWEFHPLAADKTITVHYAYSDVKKASFFIRKLVEKQPLFEHGLVIASATVALEAMKARAEGKR